MWTRLSWRTLQPPGSTRYHALGRVDTTGPFRRGARLTPPTWTTQPPVRGLPGAVPRTTSCPLRPGGRTLVVLGLAERQAGDGADDDPEEDISELGPDSGAQA